MFTQLIRNRIWRSKKFHNNITDLENVVRRNINSQEPQIIKEICDVWNKYRLIDLPPINISGTNYDTWLEFQILKTHGKLITISSDEFTSINKEYDTEFGDLAFLTDYYLEEELLSRKISIIQSKIDSNLNRVNISLRQLFLMHYWPNVSYSGNRYTFEGVYPDVFSFYHFILRHSINSQASSTVCSAPYVSNHLTLSRMNMITELSNWLTLKINRPQLNSPSRTLNMTLNSRYDPRRIWQITPKPFTRMIKECAYQFWGTSDSRILRLAQDRISNFIRLKVVSAKNKSDWVEKVDSDFEAKL